MQILSIIVHGLKIERDFSNCRIISFPHSTGVFSNKKNNYKIDKKFIEIFYF